MKRYLLLLPYEADSSNVERWIEEIDNTLDIIYVLDEEIPDEVSSWMLYTGFLGEKPTEDVVNAVKEEMKIRGEERVAELKNKYKYIDKVRVITGNLEEIMKDFSVDYKRVFILKKHGVEEVK